MWNRIIRACVRVLPLLLVSAGIACTLFAIAQWWTVRDLLDDRAQLRVLLSDQHGLDFQRKARSAEQARRRHTQSPRLPFGRRWLHHGFAGIVRLLQRAELQARG